MLLHEWTRKRNSPAARSSAPITHAYNQPGRSALQNIKYVDKGKGLSLHTHVPIIPGTRKCVRPGTVLGRPALDEGPP